MSTRAAARVAAGLLALLVGALAPTAASAATTPPTYVALGDSYAAGTGAGSYLSGSCYRSTKGYPYLIASTNGLALEVQACSGATIGNVTTLQVPAMKPDASYVTITVGGNDVGFADTLTTCLGTNTTACLTKVTAAKAKIASDAFKTSLDAMLTAVKGKAANARIVVTGYPRLFNGTDCSILTSFTSAEMTALNDGSDTLSTALRDAATRAGVGYADVIVPFKGHAVCDRSAWINNVNLFAQYNSFHPNATGYASGYQPPVKASLGLSGSTVTSTSTVTTGGTTSSDTERGKVKVTTR